MKQIDEDEIESVLCNALEEISLEKQYQEKCFLILVHALQSFNDQMSEEGRDNNFEAETDNLISKYQWIVSSVLMNTLPRVFPGL
jgi:anaphase-promoting complex subunit 2